MSVPSSIAPVTQEVHSRYGGSKIGIIIACAGYLNATSHLPDVEGDAAKLGTAAHKVGEYCLKYRIMDATFLIGTEMYGCKVDEEMAEGVNVYLQYIRGLQLKHPKAVMRVEPKVHMSSVNSDDPNVFGYIDCLITVIDEGILYVIDFKYGFGLVEVKDNSQIAHYAISALDTYKLWFTIKSVVGTIVQPRKEHYDGIVRSVTFTIEELMTWRDTIVDAIRASKQPDAKRTAGKHCTYCLVRGECRARMLHTVTMTTANTEFGNLTDQEVSVILAELPAIEKNIEAIKEHALRIARGGNVPEGHKLVRANARASCTDSDAFIKELKAIEPDFDTSELYWPSNMKGKTELKKRKSKEVIKLIDKYFPTPDANTSLVPLSNPKSAISTNAAQAFKDITL